MISILTKLKVADNSGAYWVQCIKILGSVRRRNARIGDVLVVVVKRINTRKKMKTGILRFAIVVRTKDIFIRSSSVFYRFSENSCILVNRKRAPLSKKFKGPIFFELCGKFRFIGSVAKNII